MNTPITIGVAGHVDHGKTTLVRHLTGIDTDRRAEEKARGLSIDSGVAELKLPDGQHIALIDVPGHTDFLKNTIRGLHGVDMAILVVAADDGVMPQTREHMEILKFFKAGGGMAVLSKTDLVDEDTVVVAELELRELVSKTFLDGCPIFRFSERQPELGSAIIRGIDHALKDLPIKKQRIPFRMWIDQVKSFKGHGTVVSGTVASGRICTDEEIELLPAGIITRARSLQSHACSVSHVLAGQRIGINLHRVHVDEVGRGMCLAAPGSIQSVYMFNAEMRVLSTAKTGIKNRQRVKLYLGTSIHNALVVLMSEERLDPGQNGLVQFRLMKPLAVLPQDTFVISTLNINTVIAGGRVIETAQEKFRLIKSKTLMPILTALQQSDIHTYVDRIFDRSKGRLLTAKTLCRKTGISTDEFERLINSKVQKGELVYVKGYGALRQIHFDTMKDRFKKVLEELFHKDPLKKNISVSEVSKHFTYSVEDNLLKTVADILCQEGVIERLDGGYILSRSSDGFDEHRKNLINQLLRYAQQSGLIPFSADTFWKQHRFKYTKMEISQLLNFLFSRKKLIRLNDHRFLSLQAIEEIKERVKQAIKDNGFITVNDCTELFGYGRWGGTHVLDYLNDIGFTVRKNDKHTLKIDNGL